MATEKLPLSYKGHPLRRKDNLIYYGTMAEKYIIMLQILSTQNVDGLEMANKVSVQLQLTDPDLKSRDRVVKKTEKDSYGNYPGQNGRMRGYLPWRKNSPETASCTDRPEEPTAVISEKETNAYAAWKISEDITHWINVSAMHFWNSWNCPSAFCLLRGGFLRTWYRR